VKARVFKIEEVMWEEPPEHYSAFSKLLVNPKSVGSKHFDFRISSYQPKGYCSCHAHQVQEQIYYVLQGKGIMEMDDLKKVVDPHTVIHIPPGVRHAIYNTGLEDLVFFVITSPPEDK
jgi:mannose-6-phosphate isomerase-like protein (cupin superfamily)